MISFSIVIPVYNGERFIEQTLMSVLAQTRPADEIIVFDDGSTDSSREIVANISSKIKYVKNTEGPSGFVKAWNQAISCAQSEFISVLHQDDIVYPEFLATAEGCILNSPDIKHFFCICDYIDQTNNLVHQSKYPLNLRRNRDYQVRLSANDYIRAYQKNYGSYVHIHRCPGVITHRSIFHVDNCWYNPLAGHIADDDFFYRVGHYTDTLGYLKPLSAYRIHDKSETSSIGELVLVSRLASDYLFQIQQYRDSDRIPIESMEYFRKNFLKFNRRLIGYSLKKFKGSYLKEVLVNYYKFIRL